MEQEQVIINELQAINRKLARVDTALRGDLDHPEQPGLLARVETVEKGMADGPKIVARTVTIVSLVVTFLLGIFALIMNL